MDRRVELLERLRRKLVDPLILELLATLMAEIESEKSRLQLNS